MQVLIIAAYLISSGFMSVYHMAVDTIFICASEFNLNHAQPAIPMHVVFWHLVHECLQHSYGHLYCMAGYLNGAPDHAYAL